MACCKCDSFDACLCEKERRVPVEERDFLTDQRNERKMKIGSKDLLTTKKKQKKNYRKTKRRARETQHSLLAPTTANIVPTRSSSSRSKVGEVCSQINIEDMPSTSQNPQTENVASLPGKSYKTVARTLDRFGVSDRAGAAIVSATLQDLGLITKEKKRKDS